MDPWRHSTRYGQRHLLSPLHKSRVLLTIAIIPRWQSKPWYKPQSSGLGYLKNRLAVLFGFYTEMPGPQCVKPIEIVGTVSILTSFLRSLKSEGYRLEEMVRGACHRYIQLVSDIIK